jgi:hypothetical protein
VGFDVVISMDKGMNKEYFWKASLVLPFAFYRAAHSGCFTLVIYQASASISQRVPAAPQRP